jgi:hypothetical protein
LRDVVTPRTVGYWSTFDLPNDWLGTAVLLASQLPEHDPPSWSLQVFPPGWDFWGPCIPAPIDWLIPQLDKLLAALVNHLPFGNGGLT